MLPATLFILAVAAPLLPIRLADLQGQLPAGWTTAPVQVAEPGATCRAWTASNGRYLQLDYWPSLPPTPGGPLQVAESWPVTVAGTSATLVRTVLFRGQPDEVLVVFFSRGAHRYRLFARHETRPQMQAILATLRWQAATTAP